jgi:hypothetical protein
MTVRLTDRDVRMLAKCALCRWLTTDQLRRLYFPKATLNAVQKRLRKLADTGYLRSYREHPTAESIHAVGPKGKPLVEEQGVEVVAGMDVPGQAEHLLGVNELRIAVEQGPVAVAFCFAYWELPDVGWRYPAIPDVVFAVRSPERRAFVAEFDRMTETLGGLVEKLRRYGEGLGGFPFEAVLVVTEEGRRFDVLAREMGRREVAVPVLVSGLKDISAGGLFQTVFTEVPGGRQRKILEFMEAEGGE